MTECVILTQLTPGQMADRNAIAYTISITVTYLQTVDSDIRLDQPRQRWSTQRHTSQHNIKHKTCYTKLSSMASSWLQITSEAATAECHSRHYQWHSKISVEMEPGFDRWLYIALTTMPGLVLTTSSVLKCSITIPSLSVQMNGLQIYQTKCLGCYAWPLSERHALWIFHSQK